MYVTGKLCIYIKYADYEHESFLGTSKHLSALSFCVYCLHHMPSQWEGLVGEAKRSTHEFQGNYFIVLPHPEQKEHVTSIVNIFVIISRGRFLNFGGKQAAFLDIIGKIKLKFESILKMFLYMCVLFKP